MRSGSLSLRQSIAFVLCGVLTATCSTHLQAQAPPNPEVISLNATDGFPLKMSYYPALESKNPDGLWEAPVVLFLHGEKGSRVQWDRGSAPRGKEPVPNYLNSQGYAVLVLDFRKHGESIVDGQADDAVRPGDYPAMVAGDLVAVKQFLYEKHMEKKLNMAKLGIVATDMSVPLALAFAEADWKQVPYDDSPVLSMRTPRGQDVRAIVMISPEQKAGTIAATRSLTFLKAPQFNIGMLFIAGAEDRAGMANLRKLHAAASASPKSEDRVVQFTPEAKDSGIPLLVRAPVAISEIIKFLDERVAKAEIPWQDRRSRLNR
ncbi:MAG: hypothetical protein R3C18_08910 [Planctomycetaceae bacterium]